MSKERYNQIIDEAYTNYINKCREELDKSMKQNPGDLVNYREDTKELFIRSIKEDKHWFSGEKNFSQKWGLKIEERELNYKERWFLAYNETFDEWYERLWKNNEFHIPGCDLEDRWTADGIPTKLITLTYNNETIEVYE